MDIHILPKTIYFQHHKTEITLNRVIFMSIPQHNNEYWNRFIKPKKKKNICGIEDLSTNVSGKHSNIRKLFRMAENIEMIPPVNTDAGVA